MERFGEPYDPTPEIESSDELISDTVAETEEIETIVEEVVELKEQVGGTVTVINVGQKDQARPKYRKAKTGK